MCVTRCHLSVVGSEDLFDQDGTVRKLPILSVILSRTGRGVGEVHLVSLRIQHCICPKHVVMIAIINRLLNISRFVYQCKAVETLSAWRFGCLVASENDEREHGK